MVESEAGWSGATWVAPGHFAGARIIGAAPKSAAKMSRLNVRGDCLERPGVIPGCSADALTDVGLRHGRGSNHAEDWLEPSGVIPGSSADASAGAGLQFVNTSDPLTSSSWPRAGCARGATLVPRAQCAVGTRKMDARKDLEEYTKMRAVERRREVQMTDPSEGASLSALAPPRSGCADGLGVRWPLVGTAPASRNPDGPVEPAQAPAMIPAPNSGMEL